MTLRDRLAAVVEGIDLRCTCGHTPPHPTGHGRKAASDLILRDGPALLARIEAADELAHYLRVMPDAELFLTDEIQLALTLYSKAERESEK